MLILRWIKSSIFNRGDTELVDNTLPFAGKSRAGSVSRYELHHPVNLVKSSDPVRTLFSDVNMDNPAKFREVSMTRSCISKIGIFGILVCNLQTRPHMPKFFFDFVAPYG